nr:PREDICTED: elongation of very long chain fatty acids protein 1 [Bemisia tabaci]
MSSSENNTVVEQNAVVKFWNFVFFDLGDKRTNDWPLLGSPVPGLTILGLYLYFCLSLGRKWMANRPPFKLTKTLIAYNFIQVVVSVWIFFEALDAAWLRDYSWRCEPVDFSRTPKAMRIAWAVYMYFLAKISELLDTIFFVLRKKDNQVSFLHVYHHTTMPMIAWGAAKYFPGGHGTFIGLVNSFIHIIMYTYYMLAAFGPKMQPYLWWKKYITTLQLGQFLATFLHSCQLLIYDCGYPRFAMYFVLPNAAFFFWLFSDFYRKAYSNSKAGSRRKPSKGSDTENNNVDKNCNTKKPVYTNGTAEKIELNGKSPFPKQNGVTHRVNGNGSLKTE